MLVPDASFTNGRFDFVIAVFTSLNLFKETVYCVSEAPVSQLRFVCVDCFQKNITDMVNVLSGAQDLTRSAGFPVGPLPNTLLLGKATL